MTGSVRDRRLGLLVIVIVLIPFWVGIMWLTGFLGFCGHVLDVVASYPYAAFFNQPVQEIDVIFGMIVLLTLLVLMRPVNARRPVMTIYMITWGDPWKDR